MIGRRAPALVGLAIGGLAISSWLAAFQAGLVHTVWDPLFGSGTRRVLTSPLSRALPVPDAALGAGAYAVEGILGACLVLRIGRPTVVSAMLAALSTFGAVLAVGLTIAQPIVARGRCTLCVCSTAVSVALALGSLAEARDRWRDVAMAGPPSSGSDDLPGPVPDPTRTESNR